MYDVIVVGGGHAGIEAALASARLGLRTLLVTTRIDRIGYMSCNPAIGGLGKGHMVREIDFLGGQMGVIADETCIQFKRLNATKGPAVRGSRAQCDKRLYSEKMRQVVHGQGGLTVLEGEVKTLRLASGRCCGVMLGDGSFVGARSVVITTGTFMRGIMHVGLVSSSGGRVGDEATVGLSDQLRGLGYRVGRFKTGTPPRLDRTTIDWGALTPQYGDSSFYPFSFRSQGAYALPQVACYLSRTTEETHEVIRGNLDKSPMYCGRIEGVGPRYCPSIEDKVTRFSEKTSHQTFLEPEGLTTNSIYLQGISTSLPEEVQDRFVRTMPGLGSVRFLRYGYAVEYDYVEPTQLDDSLGLKALPGVYLAGQINGTSGYEEAAAQGLMAGVNAANYVLNREPFHLSRSEAYIGVLVDDLVTKGAEEPYRMFTSRAEHRLVLREDNTMDRLMERGYKIGLLGEKDYERLVVVQRERLTLRESLENGRVFPTEETQAKLRGIGSSVLLKPCSLADLLRRPELSVKDLEVFGLYSSDEDVYESVEIDVKYSGYIRRQDLVLEQTRRMESMRLGESLDYSCVVGLSAEEKEKLSAIRPRTLAQAKRISGVTPSAIQAILVHLKGRGRRMREMNSDGRGQDYGQLAD